MQQNIERKPLKNAFLIRAPDSHKHMGSPLQEYWHVPMQCHGYNAHREAIVAPPRHQLLHKTFHLFGSIKKTYLFLKNPFTRTLLLVQRSISITKKRVPLKKNLFLKNPLTRTLLLVQSIFITKKTKEKLNYILTNMKIIPNINFLCQTPN